MSAEEGSPSVDIPVAWVGVDETPIALANQFIIQHDPGEFTLTVGQMSPPLILGSTNEERLAQAKSIEYLPIRTLARLSMSPQRVRELIAVLQTNLDRHDETTEGLDPRKTEEDR